jgi:hypothetical protein
MRVASRPGHAPGSRSRGFLSCVPYSTGSSQGRSKVNREALAPCSDTWVTTFPPRSWSRAQCGPTRRPLPCSGRRVGPALSVRNRGDIHTRLAATRDQLARPMWTFRTKNREGADPKAPPGALWALAGSDLWGSAPAPGRTAAGLCDLGEWDRRGRRQPPRVAAALSPGHHLGLRNAEVKPHRNGGFPGRLLIGGDPSAGGGESRSRGNRCSASSQPHTHW